MWRFLLIGWRWPTLLALLILTGLLLATFFTARGNGLVGGHYVLPAPNGAAATALPTAALPSGVYLLRLTALDGRAGPGTAARAAAVHSISSPRHQTGRSRRYAAAPQPAGRQLAHPRGRAGPQQFIPGNKIRLDKRLAVT